MDDGQSRWLPVHYGVVHYGTDPGDLSQTAKSPIRLNPGHSVTVFRVRMDGLKPETTYYYTVDSMEACGERRWGEGQRPTFRYTLMGKPSGDIAVSLLPPELWSPHGTQEKV